MPTTFSDKAKWIGQLVDAGFALIPYLPDSKTSYAKEWQKTPYDPLLVAADLPNNYGVILREDILVVDVDSYKFPAERDIFAELLADLEINRSAFDTFTVRSGAGGKHYYFRVPPGTKLRNEDTDNYPGIEMKLLGRQVVGPGSVHPKTGKPYIVEHGHPARMTPAPLAILEHYKQAPRSAAQDIPWQDDGETRGRFIILLRDKFNPAIQGQGGDDLTILTALAGRDLALPEETTYALMSEYWNPLCVPPWSENELALKVASAYRSAQNPIGCKHPSYGFTVVEGPDKKEMSSGEAYQAAMVESYSRLRWDITRTGNLPVRYRQTMSNVLNLFRHEDNAPHYYNVFSKLVRYNEFSHNIDFTRRAYWHDRPKTSWDDDDTRRAIAYVNDFMSNPQVAERWCPSKDIFEEGLLAHAQTVSYHPVREYLDGLKWDGVRRIDKLFPYYAGADDDDYHRAISRCTLIAMVARVMLERTDGYSKAGSYAKHDHVVILEGAQGTGKSTFCRTLGGDWYASLHLDLRNTAEAVRAMFGVWVVELEEFIGRGKADADALKAFVSRAVDMERPVYHRTYRAVPRQSIMIATINPEDEYLPDQTGNRRFWPVATGHIRIAELARDRDQLFAEALAAYRAGENWYLDKPELAALASEKQASRTAVDAWSEKIRLWIARQEATQIAVIEELPREFIASEILNIPARDHTATMNRRIANAMRSLGWEKFLGRSGGHRATSYRKIRDPKLTKLLEDI